MTKTFIPSTNQAAFFTWVKTGSGNAVLEAVAGSGKTTTITEALPFMKGFVFLGAYNTKMAKELKERTVGLKGVKAGTFHSAGLLALRFSFKNEQLIIDDKKCINLADAIVGSHPKGAIFDQMKAPVCAIVSMAKQRGFFTSIMQRPTYTDWVDMIEHFGLADNLPDEVRLEDAIEFAELVLHKSNSILSTIDFNDMVYMPLFKNIRMLQNDWVLIDEAQDTNPTRRALAKKMLKPGGRLVAVGDPHQAIFGFTGADNDALEQIVNEFKCIKLPLTVSYRCPKAVVRHAQQWVNHIQAAETAIEGQVDTVHYKELLGKVRAGDAVLCRYNKYLVNLCFKMIRAGIPAKIEGRAIGQGLIALAKRWKVKGYDALVNRLEAYLVREVKKFMEKKQEERADQLTDKVETLLVLIERAREQGLSTVGELERMITDMFSDDVSDNKKLVVLSSIHKSKGLEWDNVFLLGRDQLQPSQFARQDWQIAQEINLIYVAVTRAKQKLVEVTGVVEEKKQYTSLR